MSVGCKCTRPRPTHWSSLAPFAGVGPTLSPAGPPWPPSRSAVLQVGNSFVPLLLFSAGL